MNRKSKKSRLFKSLVKFIRLPRLIEKKDKNITNIRNKTRTINYCTETKKTRVI